MHLYNKLNKNMFQIYIGHTVNSNNKPWAYIKFLSKRLLWWAYFGGDQFSEGLIIGKSFALQNGLGLPIKFALNTKITPFYL